MRLTFITPLIEFDIPVFLANIKLLIEKTASLQKDYSELNVDFYVALQGVDIEKYYALLESTRGLYEYIYVVYLNETGVSAARNILLGNLADESVNRYILFFDARIEYSETFLRSILLIVYADREAIIWGAPYFADIELENSGIGKISSNKNLSDIIGNPYIWNMAFRSDVLNGISFDETRGPGKSTRVKSGEDALFLNEVLYRQNNYNVYFAHGEVRHPSRNGELSKYALYASGNVELMCLLIEDNRLSFVVRTYALFHYAFYIFSSIRFLFKGADGFSVFSTRLRALFDRHPKFLQ